MEQEHTVSGAQMPPPQFPTGRNPTYGTHGVLSVNRSLHLNATDHQNAVTSNDVYYLVVETVLPEQQLTYTTKFNRKLSL
jgi:hypothetical protein